VSARAKREYVQVIFQRYRHAGRAPLTLAGFSHRRFLPEPRFEARKRYDEIRHHFVDVL